MSTTLTFFDVDAHTQHTYVTCRILGHAWNIQPPKFHHDRTDWPYGLVLNCLRCGMERFDGIDARGSLGKRSYDPPDGYGCRRDELPEREQLRLYLVEAVDSGAPSGIPQRISA